MKKTPEEIKKGLECCIESTCEPCPYGNAANCNFAIYMLVDALAYIRQLEAERDAAVADLTQSKDCGTCKYGKQCATGKFDCDGCDADGCPCQGCKYEWRGVQKD